MHHNDDERNANRKGHTMTATMTSATATAFIASNKGNDVIVSLIDGTSATGAAISVNSKGVNIKVDGKVRSFGLARVTGLALPTTAPTGTITTKDLAALVDMTPKALRVELRRLGMGVGQGRAYGFDAAAVAAVRDALGK